MAKTEVLSFLLGAAVTALAISVALLIRRKPLRLTRTLTETLGFHTEDLTAARSKRQVFQRVLDSLAVAEQHAPQHLLPPAPAEVVAMADALTHGPPAPVPRHTVDTQLGPLGLPAMPYGSFVGRLSSGTPRALADALTFGKDRLVLCMEVT